MCQTHFGILKVLGRKTETISGKNGKRNGISENYIEAALFVAEQNRLCECEQVDSAKPVWRDSLRPWSMSSIGFLWTHLERRPCGEVTSQRFAFFCHSTTLARLTAHRATGGSAS